MQRYRFANKEPGITVLVGGLYSPGMPGSIPTDPIDGGFEASDFLAHTLREKGYKIVPLRGNVAETPTETEPNPVARARETAQKAGELESQAHLNDQAAAAKELAVSTSTIRVPKGKTAAGK